MPNPILRFQKAEKTPFSDWECVSMGECFSERKQRASGGETLLSVTISNGVKLQSDSNKRDTSSEDKSNYKVVKIGDIAYNTMRMWQGAEGLSIWDGIVSPAYTVITPKEGINAEFFELLFKTEEAIKLFTIYSQGLSSDNWNLKFDVFADLEFFVPCLEEQEKIVQQFKHINNQINNQISKIQSLEARRKGTLQQIFSQEIRFKADDGSDFEDWEETLLSDILTERKEKSTGKEEVYSVSVAKGLVNQIEHLGRSFAAEDTSKYKVIRPGDVVYTKSPTGEFKWGIVKQSMIDKNVIVSPLYGIFIPKSEAIGFVLDAYFSSSVRAHNYLITQVRKGAKNTINVSNDEFLDSYIMLPTSEEEAKKIKDFITLLDQQIKIEKDKLEAIKNVKKGLLQQMFV